MIEFSEDVDVQKPLQRNLRDLLMQVLVVLVSEVFPLVSILYGSSKATLTLLKGFFGGVFLYPWWGRRLFIGQPVMHITRHITAI